MKLILAVDVLNWAVVLDIVGGNDSTDVKLIRSGLLDFLRSCWSASFCGD